MLRLVTKSKPISVISTLWRKFQITKGFLINVFLYRSFQKYLTTDSRNDIRTYQSTHTVEKEELHFTVLIDLKSSDHKFRQKVVVLLLKFIENEWITNVMDWSTTCQSKETYSYHAPNFSKNTLAFKNTPVTSFFEDMIDRQIDILINPSLMLWCITSVRNKTRFICSWFWKIMNLLWYHFC